MYTRGLALAAALLAAALDLLDGTVVNIVLPAIQRELHTGHTGHTGHTESTAAAWIASGYTLALGVLLTVGGRAGEVFGPRRVLTAGVCGFALASLACAAAPTASALVLARIAQGAMAAFMVPQVLTLVQLLYPPDQRGRALSLFATVAGLATVSGPLAGALLAEADLYGLGWRAVFLINVPLSVLVVAGTRAMPQVPRRPSRQLGLPSAVLLALGLLSWMFPLLHGSADS